MSLLNGHAKWNGIVLMQQPTIEIGGRSSTSIFIAIRQKMLDQRSGQPIPRIIALQSLDESNRHRTCQRRIFSIRFFAPSPAWIPGQVGIRSTHDEPATVKALKDIACLVTFLGGGFLNQTWVPCLPQAHWLRKLCGRNDRLTSPFPGRAGRMSGPPN